MREALHSVYTWALFHQPWGPTLAAFHTNSARDSRGVGPIAHLESSTFVPDTLKTFTLLVLGAAGVKNGEPLLTAVAIVTCLAITEFELGIMSHLTRK